MIFQYNFRQFYILVHFFAVVTLKSSITWVSQILQQHQRKINCDKLGGSTEKFITSLPAKADII